MPGTYNNIKEIPDFMFNSYEDLLNSYNRGEIGIKTSIYHETLQVASHISWKAGLVSLASLFLEIIYAVYCVITGTYINLLVLIPFHIATMYLRKPVFMLFPSLRFITIILIGILTFIWGTTEILMYELLALAIGLAWVLNIVWYSYCDNVIKKAVLTNERLFCNLFALKVIAIYKHSSNEVITTTYEQNLQLKKEAKNEKTSI